MSTNHGFHFNDLSSQGLGARRISGNAWFVLIALIVTIVSIFTVLIAFIRFLELPS